MTILRTGEPKVSDPLPEGGATTVPKLTSETPARRMGREAVAGERKSAAALSPWADFRAGSRPPLTPFSSFGSSLDVPDPAAFCVLCGHPGAAHAIGTDGAGWCGETTRCDCNGFQA